MNVGELFAGIGGFRLGLEKAVWNTETQTSINTRSNCADSFEQNKGGPDEQQHFRVVWANENDKYACQIYRKNFGDKELVEGDIREVKTADVPDIDLLVGGFPCQSFSIAGKRKGTGESRGTLFSQIVRVASAKRPRLLLLENVKGLLSSDDGRDFALILRTLGNLGYLLEWQVLNSKHYGVPQNRERVFIVGHLRGTGGQQIFPVETGGGYNDELGAEVEGYGARLQASDISPALRGGEKWSTFISPTLSAGYYKRQHGQVTVMQQHSHSGPDGKGRGIRMFEGVCPTLATQMGTGGNNVPMVAADRTRSYAGKGRNLESPHPYANALSGVQKDNLVLPNEQEIRRLTPTECERLQGFLDGWTSGVSDTQRYKCLGNAVTVPVIQFIGEQILKAITSEATELACKNLEVKA